MKILRGTEEIGRERWLDLLQESEFASPFQSPDFLDFFHSVSGRQSAEVYAVEEGGKLLSLCVTTMQKEDGVKGFFSRRAIIYGGPLLKSDGAVSAWQELLKAMEEHLSRRVIYAEVRNYHDYQALFPVYGSGNWSYLPYVNLQLRLKGRSLEEIMSAMRYNRRREIRQTLAEGAACRLARTEEEIRDLYHILATLYAERVKVPLPGYEYFRQLYHSPCGRVFVVKHGETVIGGAFCLVLESRGIYTLYYCGLRNYHKKIFPTHLAVASAIEFGLENGLQLLDFMGAGLKDEPYGVRQYKAEFGGELVEHGRFIKIFNPALYKVGKWGLAALKTLKS